MRVLLSWLKNFVPLDMPLEELSDALTLAGFEVDAVHGASFRFKGVVIARVEKVEAHPGADRLKIALVYDGKEHHQVVCGAENCKEGIITALALPGAEIEDSACKKIQIEKTVLRGTPSFGMLCSEKELHLSNDSSGLMLLPEGAPLGEDLAKHLYDPIIEITLTPNLGHGASILGIAREIAARFSLPYQIPERKIERELPLKFKMQVSIKNKEDCFQYHLRKIEGITVAPSPKWLQDTLEKMGLTPVNNVVDAINYTMLEVGQPMHAFDFDTLSSSKIAIKPSTKGESLLLLNGQMQEIAEGSLLIYDDMTPIALAGVMGGKNSSITEQTKNILIEAAEFSPSKIRRSVKQNGLRSDSSFRFERGIDSEGVTKALNRAVALICSLAGGTPASESISSLAKKRVSPSLELRLDQVERILGVQLSQNEIRELLERLEFTVKIGAKKAFSVTPPSYRNDISSEIDVIEEIVRLYGFNNIPKTTISFSTSTTRHSSTYLFEQRVRNKLLHLGLQEFLTCNLISKELSSIGMGNALDEKNLVSVLHAKSSDQSVLRPSFLPTLLSSIKHNHNQQTFDIHAFEIGSLHFRVGEEYTEKRALAIVMTGKKDPYHYENKPQNCDFFDLKGILENLFFSLGISHHAFIPSSLPSFHPGRGGELFIGTEGVGVIGEVHPRETGKIDIDPKRRVYFAQIDLQKLAFFEISQPEFVKLPAYPFSQRDITLTLDDKISLKEILSCIKTPKCPFLCDVQLIDIFKDVEKVGIGKQNVSLRFTYRDDAKTIETKDVEESHNAIYLALMDLSKNS